MFSFKKTALITSIGGLIGCLSIEYWMMVLACFIIGLGAGGEITLGGSIYS